MTVPNTAIFVAIIQPMLLMRPRVRRLSMRLKPSFMSWRSSLNRRSTSSNRRSTASNRRSTESNRESILIDNLRRSLPVALRSRSSAKSSAISSSARSGVLHRSCFGCQATSSRALMAHERPCCSSAIRSCSCQPVGLWPASNHHQLSRETSWLMWSWAGGH